MCGNGICEKNEKTLCPQDCGELPRWLQDISDSLNKSGLPFFWLWAMPSWLLVVIVLIILYVGRPVFSLLGSSIERRAERSHARKMKKISEKRITREHIYKHGGKDE